MQAVVTSGEGKRKATLSISASSCCGFKLCFLPRWDFPGKSTGVGCHRLLWDSIYSLPSEPPGKPKNTGVGSLSLLQGIFPTRGSNRGPLYCRQILYQLSYQGSPYVYVCMCVRVHGMRVHGMHVRAYACACVCV